MEGILICILFITGYYGMIILSLRFCAVDFIKIFRDEWWKILIICAVGTAFVFYQISLQRWIYFWDFAETWLPTINSERNLLSTPLQQLIHLYDSINYSDYNDFLPTLMTLPMHIFGKSFIAYTMYVWVMFALPAIFLIAAATKALIKKFCNEDVSCAAIIGIVLMIPLIEMPVMNGYANVSMMMEGIILFLILLNLDEEKFQPVRLICAALLSILAVLQSRTAAYMILSLYFGYAIYTTIWEGGNQLTLRVKLFALIRNLLCIGLIAAGLMTLIFYPFVEHALTYNHGMAYSAYAGGNSVGKIIWINFLHIGPTLCILLAVSLLAGFYYKKIRPHIIFLTAWTATSLILISRIQLMGTQHYYTILVPVSIITAAAIMLSFKRRKIICAALVFLLTFNFAHSYSGISALDIVSKEVFKYTPFIRNDVEEIKNFIGEINKLTAGEKKVYILSGSELYNSESFNRSYMPDLVDAIPNLMSTANIDLRDGFPIHFFDADFVITTEPVQIHMREQDQAVVAKLTELVTSMPLAGHFKLVMETSLYPKENDNYHVTFKVYEKISHFNKSDIDFVENVFTELYPDNPALFKDRFEKYKSEK